MRALGATRATLHIRGLSREFGPATAPLKAVDQVDLDVPAGQMLAIIGRSGAGKSTLMRMINRLQKPTSGTIHYGDIDVTALSGRALRNWRADCAMIFQQFNLIPRADVLTNVLTGRLNHRAMVPSLLGLFTVEERAMAIQTLDRFGLVETALQRASTLSGGQQQRVAICRALMQEPLVLLADEPIASLDPHNARLVMDALRQINREDGLTVLTNLHHLDAAREYCDRVVAMERGRIVFDDVPSRLTAEVIMAIYGISEHEFHAVESDKLRRDQ